eukprot:555340_1
MMSTLYHSHSRCGKHKKQSLVHGYIKQNCTKLKLNIPMDIVDMFYTFYDEIFYWHLKGDEFKEFKSKLNTHSMTSPSFYFNNYLFECGAFPNGRLESQREHVIFYISMPNITSIFNNNNNIEQLIIYFELFCQETNSQWKGIRVYVNDNKKSAGWSAKTLPLKLCKTFDSLWLSCYVEILRIKYKSNPTVIGNNLNCKYNNNIIKYEWLIDEELLYDVTHCNFGKTFFSKDFGNDNGCKWLLMMAPNLNTNIGKEMDKKFQCLFVCLRCIRIPEYMENVNVKYLIECDWSDKKQENMERRQFSYDQNLSAWQYHSISDKEFEIKSSMLISVTIHIQ